MVDISRARAIEGWMRSSELTWLAEQSTTHSAICEVGSWKGRSTRALADHTPGKVWAVDNWRGPHDLEKYYTSFAELIERGGQEIFRQFCANLEPHISTGKVVPICADSVESARLFVAAGQTFDMVFIDADHAYDCIRDDILAYQPLVRPGGLLCGHDFGGYNGVTRAVEEMMPGYQVIQSIWYKEVR